MAHDPKLCSAIHSTSAALAVQLQSGIVMLKNWVFSVDQCQLTTLQFPVHLINLLSIFLICNDFTGIQKAVVDQTSSRPQASDHDLFGFMFGFGKRFGALSPTTELVIVDCHIKSTFCHK